MKLLYVNAPKEVIEQEIVRAENYLTQLKAALETGNYRDHSKCKHCAGSGWVWINPFTTGIRNCSCEYGKKRIPNTPQIELVQWNNQNNS